MNNKFNNKENSNTNRSYLAFVQKFIQEYKRKKLLWILFAISPIAVVTLYAYSNLSEPTTQISSTSKVQMPTIQECETETLTDKTYYILDQQILISPDRLHSNLDLINHHNHRIVMQINSADNQTPFMLISLFPNSQMQVSLPIGTYGAHLKVGNIWCNKQIGFSDGEIIDLDNPLEIFPETTQKIRIEAKGSSLREVKVSFESLSYDEAMQVHSLGITELVQQNDGHYHINGEINKFAVHFLVDTGAAYTSIPSNIADNLGIKNCVEKHFSTGNGKTTGCVGFVSDLRFGNFRIQNVEVAVLPNLSTPLLGMNILSQINVESSRGLMRLSKN